MCVRSQTNYHSHNFGPVLAISIDSAHNAYTKGGIKPASKESRQLLPAVEEIKKVVDEAEGKR